jgi:DNA polymerase-3 subunit gamma/tau
MVVPMTSGSGFPFMIESERPKDFAGVVGQEAVIGTLQQRIREGRSLDRHLAFVGPAGAGKMTVARLYSQALVCDVLRQDGSPCQSCTECRGVIARSSWAYVPIDAITQGDEETIRTLVERDNKLNTAPLRVVLVQNAEWLMPSAADAALKTLEKETKTVFIFLVNDVRMFSGAVWSRCQVFQLRPVEAAVLVKHLAAVCGRHSIQYEAAALEVIARASQGLCGLGVNMLAGVAGRGDVTLSGTLTELGLAWGPALLRCWNAIFAGHFDEALSAFESVGADGPSRIRAMQAFLLELDLRDELGARTCSIRPALEALPEAAWRRVREEWERFAVSRSMEVRDLIREASEFWRGARLDAPWQILFRRAYEDLVRRTGERRVETNLVAAANP